MSDEAFETFIQKSLGARSFTFILRGKEVLPCPNFIEWAEWFATTERTLCKTEIKEFLISTVFLGVDLGYGPNEEPLVFETMIFGETQDTKLLDSIVELRQTLPYQWRYFSYDDAMAGHVKACELLKALVDRADAEVAAALNKRHVPPETN